MRVIDKMLDNKTSATALSLVLLLATALSAGLVAEPVSAQQNRAKHGGNQDDCSLFTIENKDDNSLTQQEKIAALNQSLSDSVDRYDTCIQKMSSQQQGAAGGQGGAAAGTGGAGGGAGSTDSQARQQELTDSQNSSQKQTQQTPVLGSKTGSVPKDIPSADNDSVLQGQIRAAALEETDPEKKKKLWDLYRKYIKNS